jgi:hypothetical protein
MPKYELVVNGGEYATVAERISLFYARYPRGRVVTQLLSRTDEEITVQAFVYRSLDEQHPAATGLAAERIGDGDVNTVACLENTETSAIGRALANLGLTASPHRPSREEMEKANRARRWAVSETVHRPATLSVVKGSSLTMPPVDTGDPSLQRRADRVVDALEVLSQAERAGLAPRRGRWLRLVLNDPRTSRVVVERIERTLRAWTLARHTRDLRL